MRDASCGTASVISRCNAHLTSPVATPTNLFTSKIEDESACMCNLSNAPTQLSRGTYKIGSRNRGRALLPGCLAVGKASQALTKDFCYREWPIPFRCISSDGGNA